MLKAISPLLLFTVLFLAISLSSVRQKGSTFDECSHIPAGYTYVALGDFRMNPEHPPLIKLLSGIPLRFLHPRVETNDAEWKSSNQWQFGSKFLYEWNDADQMIFWGRVPIILLSLLLGICVYFCAWDLYGWKAGCVALTLYLFNPDLLAHGQLVTTDLGLAFFMFVAVYAFYRALRRLTLWNAVLACLTVGLTLVTKFSGILIFPMLALVGVAFAFSPTPINFLLPRKESARRPIKSPRGKLVASAALVVATALVSSIIIWACYGFRYRISPDPEVSRTLKWEHYWEKDGQAYEIARITRPLRLVPEAYTYGFLYALESTEKRIAFLSGDYSLQGWWYYFIVTFFVKTPIPLIVMILLGGLFIRRYGAGLAAEAMLLLPVGFYWLVALTSNLNIGHRHLLPVYPFLIVFASKVARAFDEARQQRALVVACAILIAWNIAETAFIYPHFLGYFNEIAGGPSGGYHWLVDSNLDWGQDLKGLAKYRREHPDEPFYLSYFGTGKPEFYGIQGQFLPGFNLEMTRERLVPFSRVTSGATVAVSATNLQCVYLRNQQVPGIEQFMQRLKSMQPVANIGYSIFIYRIP